MKLLANFFGIFLLIVSCHDDKEPTPISDTLPKACFIFSQPALQNNAVSFDPSCSENGKTYSWDFGDGAFSDLQNPTHTYKIDGEFVVKLRVSADNKVDSLEQKITVTLSDSQLKCLPSYILSGTWPEIEADSIAFAYASNKLADIKWFYGKNNKYYATRMLCEYNGLKALTKLNLFLAQTISPADDQLVSTFHFQYGTNSLPSRIDWVNKNGDSLKTSKYFYDDRNRLVEIQNRSFGTISRTKYEYNQSGNTRKVFHNSGYFNNQWFLGKENIDFDGGLAFYNSSSQLKMVFEYIYQVEPYRNSPKTVKVFATLDMGSVPTWYGGGPINNPTGSLLQHDVGLNDKLLVDRLWISNTNMPYFLSGVYFYKAGYVCPN
jgi:PKD repeat protein